MVLRGLSADGNGKLVFYAWGKQNLGQFPSAEASLSADASMPRLLAPLPHLVASTASSSSSASKLYHEHDERKEAEQSTASLGSPPQIVEVWCGSEFTIAADANGGLWGCGWNEHGNLGIGKPAAAVSNTGAVVNNSSNCVSNSAVDDEEEDSVHSVVRMWKPIMRSGSLAMDDCSVDGVLDQVRLSHVWEGAVACGGGHVIALAP